MMENNFLEGYEGKPLIHSKLGFSSEGGGKTRIFAMGDYWTQFSLKPIHKVLMSILRNLETDGTYDQESAFQRILTNSKGKETFCFDLSGASDRIPIKVQSIMMSSLFGPRISEDWTEILVNRQFHTPKGNVSWKVGQPLGFLSSWGAFALWHHIFIEYCASKEGMRSFRDYQVLGDDVAIWNRKVAIRYQDGLGELGIPINLSKSVTGCSSHSQIEFAKRHAIGGEEVSGISYNVLAKNSLRNVIELVLELDKRSLIDTESCFQFVQVPSLGKRRLELLNFLIWSCLPVSPPNKEGLLTLGDVDPDALRLKAREIRTDRILKKVMDFRTLLGGDKPIEKYFESHNLHYNPNAVGTVVGLSQTVKAHPLMWVINHKSEDLMTLVTQVMSGLDQEISEVEYLPSIPYKEFFHNSKTAKVEFFTAIIIDAYHELISKESGIQ